MSQFGGSPRDQDFGFFTTPVKPSGATSQFGSEVGNAANEAPLPPAFGLPAPPRRAHAQHTRSRRRPLLFVLAVVLALVAGWAAYGGMVPGLNQQADAAASFATPAAKTYTVAAPRTLLGWKRSSGDQAKQIDLLLRSAETFPDDQVTTFLYLNSKKKPTLYGQVTAAPASKAQQKAFLVGISTSLSDGSKRTSVSAFKNYKPGALGGVLRCAKLGTTPASTACVFSNSGASGLVVLVGRSGNSAVDNARQSREALVKPSE